MQGKGKVEDLYIRKMIEGDIPLVLEMILAYRQEVPGVKPVTSEGVEEMLLGALDNSGAINFVALEGENLVGFCNCHVIFFPLIGGVEVYISDLLVLREARGRGIGSMLIDEAEKNAREKGCLRLMLNNSMDSESYERGFYMKKGFTPRGRMANYIKFLI